MLKKYIILPLFLLVAACIPETTIEKPENLIAQEQFIEVLCDIHMADAVLSNQRLHDNELKDTTATYYNYVYQKHSITRVQFNKSLKYYTSDPAKFSIMYKDVVARMEKIANEVSSK